MSEELGPIATVTHDGFSISSNEGTAKSIKANLEADPAPLDGSPKDAEAVKDKEAKKKRSEAASELGKAGGRAAAEARKAQDDLADEDEAPEAKEPEKKAVEAPEDEEEPVKGNPRHDAKARIQQLARERSEERSKRMALEARLEALEAQGSAPPAKEAQPERAGAPDASGKPQPSQYETYEEYVEALTDHKMEERIKRMSQEAQDRQRVEAATSSVIQRVEKFNQKVKEAPDLIEKVDPRLLDLQPTFTLPPGKTPGPQNDLAEEIVSSDMAPALLVYLTEHENEVRRILALPNAREIARAVAKLEDRLDGTATPVPPHTMQEGSVKQITYSQAKPPVRPVTSTPASSDEDVDEDTPFDKHYSIMQSREARLRRAK